MLSPQAQRAGEAGQREGDAGLGGLVEQDQRVVGEGQRDVPEPGEPLTIDGQLAGFITTYTDITERKAVEQALQTQHDLLQTVIESIPSAVSLFDKHLNLALHNRELLRLLDLPEALLADQPVPMERIFRYNA